MPVFLPCAGTRAQIDARPVADGQFLVATDTGEAFVDIGGRRIAISGSSPGGTGGDDDDGSPLFTTWPIACASLKMSDSVSGGGPGAGVLNAPASAIDAIDGGLHLAFAVTNADLLVSPSVPGGGPSDGVTGTPVAGIPEIAGNLNTSYSITEAQ